MAESNQQRAKPGDTVRVHYQGSLDDGSVFDSSRGSDPFEFTLGKGMVIQGFDDAVAGMEVGATRTVAIQPEDAYGDRVDALVLDVPRDQFPESIEPEVGMPLQLRSDDGSTMGVTITDIEDDTVTLDGNHPLAGEVLHFEIELVEIVASTAA